MILLQYMNVANEKTQWYYTAWMLRVSFSLKMVNCSLLEILHSKTKDWHRDLHVRIPSKFLRRVMAAGRPLVALRWFQCSLKSVRWSFFWRELPYHATILRFRQQKWSYNLSSPVERFLGCQILNTMDQSMVHQTNISENKMNHSQSTEVKAGYKRSKWDLGITRQSWSTYQNPVNRFWDVELKARYKPGE